jgi:putative sigma-54 modulation protein
MKEISKIHRKDRAAVASRKVARALQPSVVFAGPEAVRQVISEVKRFDVKPLSIEEAINQMTIMGYRFYMFMNAETSLINVVYHKDNGTYGLLEPEM